MVLGAIEKIRLKFEDDTKIMLGEITRLKISLKEKENQLSKVTSMLNEREIVIEQFERRAESKLGSLPLSKADSMISFGIEVDERSLRKDEIIEQLRSEIKATQNICSLLRQDEAKASSELSTTKKELEIYKTEFEEKIKKDKDEMQKKIDSLRNDLTRVTNE